MSQTRQLSVFCFFCLCLTFLIILSPYLPSLFVLNALSFRLPVLLYPPPPPLPPAAHYHKQHEALKQPAVGSDLSLKHLDASSVNKDDPNLPQNPWELPKTCHLSFFSPQNLCCPFFCFILITVLFPLSPLWKGSEVPRIASYLISPSACGHMVARLRKKRQSGTILIIPTF